MLCLLSGTVLAHGGQYRGPTTGGPAVPTGPVTPGAPVPGGPTTGGNANLDINSWRVWWQLNHDRFVSGGASKVTDDERRSIVLPTLKAALEGSKSPDVVSASLVAMGKAAVDHPSFKVLDLLRERLSDAHLEIRDAAVLAMGLSGRAEAIDDLGALLADGRAGRQLVSRASVPDRVRTFAAYALGLMAAQCDSAADKARALACLIAALEDSGITDRDLLAAALNGIRIIGADPAKGAAHKRVLWTAMAALEAHQQRRLTSKLAVVQSHGLTALAHLARFGSESDQKRVRDLAIEVLTRRREAEPESYVSATIALGELLRPEHEEELAALVGHVRKPRDSLVPKFAMIAFGQIGGEVAFEQLNRAFRLGKRDLQPWAALGLGLLARGAPATPPNSQQARDWRGEVGDLLQKGLKSENSDDLRAAIAIGLGLAGEKAAAPELRELTAEMKGAEDARGLVCVSLAMLDDRASVALARDAMQTVERPILFGHGALALARFGERGASTNAVAALAGETALRPGYLTRLAAAAQAIGYLDNPNDMAALADIILGTKSARSGRIRVSPSDFQAAFAAAALGSIADRDGLGFGARIAHGMNYTVREQTISDGKNGILDIF